MPYCALLGEKWHRDKGAPTKLHFLAQQNQRQEESVSIDVQLAGQDTILLHPWPSLHFAEHTISRVKHKCSESPYEVRIQGQDVLDFLLKKSFGDLKVIPGKNHLELANIYGIHEAILRVKIPLKFISYLLMRNQRSSQGHGNIFLHKITIVFVHVVRDKRSPKSISVNAIMSFSDIPNNDNYGWILQICGGYIRRSLPSQLQCGAKKQFSNVSFNPDDQVKHLQMLPALFAPMRYHKLLEQVCFFFITKGKKFLSCFCDRAGCRRFLLLATREQTWKLRALSMSWKKNHHFNLFQ